MAASAYLRASVYWATLHFSRQTDISSVTFTESVLLLPIIASNDSLTLGCCGYVLNTLPVIRPEKQIQKRTIVLFNTWVKVKHQGVIFSLVKALLKLF